MYQNETPLCIFGYASIDQLYVQYDWWLTANDYRYLAEIRITVIMTSDNGYTLLIVTTIHDPGYSITRLANFVWIDWIGIMKLWGILSIHIKNQLLRLIEFYQMLILRLPMIILQIKCFFSLSL